MEKVLVIVGQTAVGKTAMSIRLAKALNGEIINGDAMQVYKDLNIVTDKITKEKMQGVPHHLLDIKTIDEDYSVAKNYKGVFVKTHAKNNSSMNLYKNIGFKDESSKYGVFFWANADVLDYKKGYVNTKNS